VLAALARLLPGRSKDQANDLVNDQGGTSVRQWFTNREGQ
jgi:hypothetical protein